MLSIRITADFDQRLRALCEKRDLTTSEFTRGLLIAAVDHIDDMPPSPLPAQIARLPARQAAPGLRGFSIDGEPLTAYRGPRFKTKREK